MLLSMAVLVVIILITGEPLTWYWLLAIPVLLLQTIFNVGRRPVRGPARLAGQRLQPAAAVPAADLDVPLRRAVQHRDAAASAAHRWLVAVLQLNPAALYITLMRNALLLTQRQSAPGSQAVNAQLCAVWTARATMPDADQAQLMHSALLPVRTPTRSLLVLRHRLGGARPRGRVLLLLASGGEVRPWLSQWWSSTTCTSSTASTARAATAAPPRPRCCGSWAARPAAPSARCTRSAACRSSPTAATPSASSAATARASRRCCGRSPACCRPSRATSTPPARRRCSASTPRCSTT